MPKWEYFEVQWKGKNRRLRVQVCEARRGLSGSAKAVLHCLRYHYRWEHSHEVLHVVECDDILTWLSSFPPCALISNNLPSYSLAELSYFLRSFILVLTAVIPPSHQRHTYFNGLVRLNSIQFLWNPQLTPLNRLDVFSLFAVRTFVRLRWHKRCTD